jgi:glycerol-1-phosphate dehydrogenase [NAD(P)+]
MLKRRVVEIPKFIKIEGGISSSIIKILRGYGLSYKKIVLFTGPKNGKTYNLAQKILEKSLLKNILCVEIEPKLKCRNSVYNVKKLSLNHLLKGADLLIGFGGCGVLDIVKHIAFIKGINYLLVPTTVSNDGIASPISVIINSKKIPISHFTKPPLGVFLDLDILNKSSKEIILSGIWDTLSNISAIKDWELAHKEINEEIDDFAKLISIASANFVYEHIDELIENPDNIFSSKFIEKLVYGLVLSGLSMAVYGTSRPCSGSEHKFYHSLNRLYKKANIPHGIQVAIGMVYAEYLRKEEYLKYIKLGKSLGIPLSSGQIKKTYGLSKDVLICALAKSVHIRKGKRYTIFENKNLNIKRARSIINDIDKIISLI